MDKQTETEGQTDTKAGRQTQRQRYKTTIVKYVKDMFVEEPV